jgi:signal transduction histidine kinase
MCNYTEHSLSMQIFTYREDSETKYIQVKMRKFFNKKEERLIIQFIDISMSILYNVEKTQNQMLEMINACVSHEMRNPLNSIIAQNLEKKHLYKEMEQATILLEKNPKDVQPFIQKSKELMVQLNEGMRVQDSSATILQFQVQDLLDYAQIKSGKFRKNNS